MGCLGGDTAVRVQKSRCRRCTSLSKCRILSVRPRPLALEPLESRRLLNGAPPIPLPPEDQAGFWPLDHDSMVELSHARGGDPDRPGKRDPIDPLLWRGERLGEPAWDGGDELGPGRPGWHIECTALALEHLGAPFDVQVGGHDLVFPHHEMSALQSVALTGSPTYAEHHLYQALVAYEGEKMSKSKGNLVFVSALREAGVDPMVVRALILGQHYRSEWEYTEALLKAAEARVARWREALSVNTGPDAQATIDRIRAALANDLNGPAALDALDDWADLTLTGGGGHADGPGLVSRAMDALLGLRL